MKTIYQVTITAANSHDTSVMYFDYPPSCGDVATELQRQISEQRRAFATFGRKDDMDRADVLTDLTRILWVCGEGFNWCMGHPMTGSTTFTSAVDDVVIGTITVASRDLIGKD